MHAKQGGSLYYYDDVWYDPAGARTCDLTHESRNANHYGIPTRNYLYTRLYNISIKEGVNAFSLM